MFFLYLAVVAYVLWKLWELLTGFLFLRRQLLDVSNYQSEWKVADNNEEFWEEVLVGREVTDVVVGEKGIEEIHLSSGETIYVDDGAAISVKDGSKPYQFFPRKPKALKA